MKVKIIGQTGNNEVKGVEINCAIVSINNANQNATFSINERKLYVHAVTLSTQNYAKLSQHLKSIF